MTPPDAVTVYTKPHCPPCMGTKRLLDKAEIKYHTVDLADDLQALESVQALGYTQSPVVVVRPAGATEDVHWSGLNPNLIEKHITGDPRKVAA